MQTEITKIIETETGHRLTNYSGKCAHLHGHRYRWEVTVTADQLDETGFIIDYGDLKKVLKETVDEIDHAFLFHDQDPLVKIADIAHSNLDPDPFAATNGQIGRIFILPFSPTSENIMPWMAERIKEAMPERFNGVRLTHIRLWETSGSYADWHEPYSSGL